MARWIALAALGSLPWLSGCGRVGRARECQELARLVNQPLSKVEALAKKDQPEKDLREIASLYGKLHEELGPVELSSKPLAEAVAEFRKRLKTIADQSKKAADARGKEQRGPYLQARREIATEGRLLRGDRAAIERLCR